MVKSLNKLVWRLHILAAIYYQFIIMGILQENILKSFQGKEIDVISLSISYIVGNLYLTTFIISYPFVLAFVTLIYFFCNKLKRSSVQKTNYVNKILDFSLKNVKNLLILFLIPLISFLLVLTLGLYIPMWIFEGLTGWSAFFAPKDAMNLLFNFKNVFIYGVPGYVVFAILLGLSKLFLRKSIRTERSTKEYIMLLKKK